MSSFLVFLLCVGTVISSDSESTILTREDSQLMGIHSPGSSAAHTVLNDVSGNFNRDKTFEFIELSQNNLQLVDNPNAILVLGNKVSGKSTLVHYVAGDPGKLKSISSGNQDEYKIQDESDPIISSEVFRSIVPEMVIDEEQYVWYDFPGGEQFDSQTEIAKVFLFKRIIENAPNVKIVLTVDYDSIVAPIVDLSFEHLLTYVSELLRDINVFNDSVSMIVTNVPAFQSRIGFEKLNESIRNMISRLLYTYRGTLIRAGSHEKKIQLLDAILNLNGDYPRIAIFWRLSEAGAFNGISKMINGRKAIRKMIVDHTKYAKVQKDNFDFCLSDESQRLIRDMTQLAFNRNSRIPSVLPNIDDEINHELEQTLESINGLQTRLKLLSFGEQCSRLSNGDDDDDFGRLEQLINVLEVVARELNMTSIVWDDFDSINSESEFRIIKTLSDTPFDSHIRELIADTSKTINLCSTEHNWYSFLVRVLDFFSSYEVQRDVTRYNVANILDWGQTNKPQGLKIDDDNFAEFKTRFPGAPYALKLRSNFDFLNEIIKFTLQSTPEYDCDAETLTITGNFVKSSDIRLEKCPSDRISKVNVHVLSTIFVDSHLNFNGIDDLNIFAYKWDIIQTATFDLNGSEGESYNPSQFKKIPSKSGGAGMNGGNFIGLAYEMINGDRLTINLNGGNGGNGQDGIGNKDVSVILPENHQKEMLGARFMHPDSFYRNFFKLKDYDAELISRKTSPRKSGFLIAGIEIYHKFRLHPAKCCGATGMGGLGKINEIIQIIL